MPLISVFNDFLLLATLNRFELTTGDDRPDTTDVCCKVTGGKPSSQPCNITYAMHSGEKSNTFVLVQSDGESPLLRSKALVSSYSARKPSIEYFCTTVTFSS